MSYEQKIWETGEVITADGLNNIEGGIQEALGHECVLILYENDSSALDKTYEEIEEAFNSGKLIIIYTPSGQASSGFNSINIVIGVGKGDWSPFYHVIAWRPSDINQFTPTTRDYVVTNKDEYPAWD